MPSPKKKYPYAIIREDNSYNVYDITRADYGIIKEGLLSNTSYVEISIGILSLKDVRSVIEQIVVEETKEKEKEANPPMTPEEREWYNEMKELLNFDDEEVDF